MDAKLVVPSISANCRETEAISVRMVWREVLNIGTASGLKC